jgi:hypothetical protein
MPIPDRIEHTIELAQPPERVWTALTTAEGLGSWFGDHAAVDLRPGGPGYVEWDDEDAKVMLTIIVVEPPVGSPGPGRSRGCPTPTAPHLRRVHPRAERRRDTADRGGVRVREVPDELIDTAYQGNVAGWRKELADLADYLHAAA